MTFLIIILGIILALLRALVLQSLWLWFVHPLGVTEISFLHALGLGQIAILILLRISGKDLERTKEETVILQFYALICYLIIWGVGYLAHYWM